MSGKHGGERMQEVMDLLAYKAYPLFTGASVVVILGATLFLGTKAVLYMKEVVSDFLSERNYPDQRVSDDSSVTKIQELFI